METWIRRACRQRAYRQLVLWTVITAAIVAFAIANSRYLDNFFHGPYRITASGLASITNAGSSEQQFLAVSGEKVVPSGIQEITTETRNGVKERSYVSSEYYLILTKGRRLLIVQSHGQPPLNIIGEIKSPPAGLANSIFPDPADYDLKARLYPFILSTIDDYRVPGYIALAGAMLYVVIVWFFAGRAWRYARDVSLHPVVRRIEKLPDAVELAALSEREMESAVRFKKPGLVITDNFAINYGLFTFNLFPFRHLLWVYKKVTTKRINFIPIAKTSEAVFVFYGGKFSFPSRKKLVEEILAFAVSRAPWAVVGYTDEISNIFKKDQKGFCAAVEAKRLQTH